MYLILMDCVFFYYVIFTDTWEMGDPGNMGKWEKMEKNGKNGKMGVGGPPPKTTQSPFSPNGDGDSGANFPIDHP